VTSKREVDYGLIQTNWAQNMKVFGTLPAGHKVFIKDVREEVRLDDEDMMPYGRTTLPWNNKDVTFAYSWGSIWILHPAPWEPDDTPDRRGPPGELPPHFNYPMFQPPPGTPKWGLRGRTNSVPASATTQPTPTNNISTAPILQENKVPDARRIDDAPRVPDPPR
jgi:hypothetical protein